MQLWTSWFWTLNYIVTRKSSFLQTALWDVWLNAASTLWQPVPIWTCSVLFLSFFSPLICCFPIAVCWDHDLFSSGILKKVISGKLQPLPLVLIFSSFLSHLSSPSAPAKNLIFYITLTVWIIPLKATLKRCLKAGAPDTREQLYQHFKLWHHRLISQSLPSSTFSLLPASHWALPECNIDLFQHVHSPALIFSFLVPYLGIIKETLKDHIVQLYVTRLEPDPVSLEIASGT